MVKTNDAFGAFLLDHHRSGVPSAELIERDDGFIDLGSPAGMYFSPYEAWPEGERKAIGMARGSVLDIGCGAGRHALHLQGRGLGVVGIDDSQGAIRVCKLRGVKRAEVLSVTGLRRLAPRVFDTVLMLGNNFGLMGSPARARKILTALSAITSDDAVILAGTRNPYRTREAEHLAYHRRNRGRERLPGQLRLRVRYRTVVGRWFDYLFVSPEEMESVLAGTGWRVARFIEPRSAVYHAVIVKA